MKFDSLDRRLREIEPDPVDLEEQRDLEYTKLLLQAFEPHFMERLTELGLSDLIPEMKAALQTVGPRPFGHSRPDDRPVWVCIDEVSDRHHESAYLIRAADSLAWADVYVELGAAEDDKHVVRLRETAARDIARDKKDRQPTCDRCGRDFNGWSCYSGAEMEKLCKTCAGL